MEKTEAQVRATRETLRALVKASPHTQKWIAARIGEDHTVLSRRLNGTRDGYRHIDTALVVNLLAVLDVPLVDFFTQVEARADQLMSEDRRRR